MHMLMLAVCVSQRRRAYLLIVTVEEHAFCGAVAPPPSDGISMLLRVVKVDSLMLC